jgi:hypothetical protein
MWGPGHKDLPQGKKRARKTRPGKPAYSCLGQPLSPLWPQCLSRGLKSLASCLWPSVAVGIPEILL